MRRILSGWVSAVLLLLTFVPQALAAEKADPAAVARAVEPYLDDTTLLVVHVDFSRLELEPVRKAIEDVVRKLQLPAQQTEGMLAGLGQGFAGAKQWVGEFTNAGGGEAFVVVN